jgi:hypothetical protein
MKKLVGAAPWIFIVIWSSGFVVAKYGFTDSDSLFFLAVRLLLASAILFLKRSTRCNARMKPSGEDISSVSVARTELVERCGGESRDNSSPVDRCLTTEQI